MDEKKKSNWTFGSAVTAVVLALIGLANNYRDTQNAEAKVSDTQTMASKGYTQTASLLNSLMEKNGKLEERVFRLEDRLLQAAAPTPAALAKPSTPKPKKKKKKVKKQSPAPEDTSKIPDLTYAPDMDADSVPDEPDRLAPPEPPFPLPPPPEPPPKKIMEQKQLPLDLESYLPKAAH